MSCGSDAVTIKTQFENLKEFEIDGILNESIQPFKSIASSLSVNCRELSPFKSVFIVVGP